MIGRKAVVAATALALLLTGCGRGSDNQQDSAKPISEGKAKGDITVWAMGTEGEKLSTLAKDFMTDNPDAKVTVTAVPWDAAHQKISGAIAGKQTPDVSMVGTTWMGEFAKTGALDLLSLPDELIEAARVDGAGEFRIFWRIVLPLSRPALATLGILTFLASWNNFLWPLVVATTEDKYTLPVALALYSVGQNRINFGLALAGAVVVVLPVLLVFLLLQRYFLRGIATTGLK